MKKGNMQQALRKANDFTVHSLYGFVQTEAACPRQIPAMITRFVDTMIVKTSKQTRSAVPHFYEEVMNVNLGQVNIALDDVIAFIKHLTCLKRAKTIADQKLQNKKMYIKLDINSSKKDSRLSLILNSPESEKSGHLEKKSQMLFWRHEKQVMALPPRPLLFTMTRVYNSEQSNPRLKLRLHF